MLVYFGVILVMLLGFCGLAIDVGRMELRTAQLQAAADEGAISAAAEAQRTPPSMQQGAALNAATTNVAAFEAANNIPTANTTVTTINPATAGTFANDLFAVQTTITQKFPLNFLGLVTKANMTTVSASAVALIPPCAFFFSSPGTGNSYGFNVASAGFFSPCPVYAQTGFIVDGFSWYSYGQARATGTSGGSTIQGSMYPTPVYSVPTQPDPLAYLVAPSFSGTCDHTGAIYTKPQTLQPGTYCGGLTVNNTTVTMQPGLYIVTGGVNFTTHATINGSGVTIYLTQGGGSGFGTFSLNRSSNMYLSAPTDSLSGRYPGILLFADRAWVGGAQDFRFDSSTFQGDGIIYVRGTGIYDWKCNLSGPSYFSIVTENMYSFGSTTSIANNYAPLSGGNPLHVTVSLVQ